MKDFNFNDNSVLVTDERDLLVQQIDLLFDTNYGEVFGEVDFGADFHSFLWDLTVSNQEISSYTRSIIMRNINLMGWSISSIDTQILAGTENDIILISIVLEKDFDKIEKTYKIV